ncbi:MAG: prepilin peptidase, partial [Geobacter sp.]|nr:prepilin peptidase [Geobacter sp.]
FLGVKAVPFIIFSSSLVGTVAGLSIMALQRKGRHLAIPFGPYLAFGALLYIFYGPQLITWYLQLGR